MSWKGGERKFIPSGYNFFPILSHLSDADLEIMNSFCKHSFALKKKKKRESWKWSLWHRENESLVTLGKQHLKSWKISLFSWPLFSKLPSLLCHACIRFQSGKGKSTNPTTGSCSPSRSSAGWDQELISSSLLNHNWLRMLRSLLLPNIIWEWFPYVALLSRVGRAPLCQQSGVQALLNPNYTAFNVSLEERLQVASYRKLHFIPGFQIPHSILSTGKLSRHSPYPLQLFLVLN